MKNGKSLYLVNKIDPNDLRLIFFYMVFDSKVILNSYYIKWLELRALLELRVLFEKGLFKEIQYIFEVDWVILSYLVNSLSLRNTFFH